MTPVLAQDVLTKAYREMRAIREFEERLHREFPSQEIPGAVHLYAGQEAIAVGVCAHLAADDHIASTHRGHGHAIAKGCDVGAMMLEIYGKAGGLCGGKGGSMHLADFDRGMLGANGVAGGGVPLACGAALSAKVLGTQQVGVAFVGDGGANQGAFLESLNLAAVLQLPVVFVVEDNGYAQATPTGYHLRGIDVAKRAEGFGLPGTTVDGTDFFAVHQAAGEAIARARAGGGPSLLECRAMRFYGHMEGWDQQTYRPPDEVEELRATSDCLAIFTARVLDAGLLAKTDLEAIDREVALMIDAAVAAAQAAPSPGAEQLHTDVYVSF